MASEVNREEGESVSSRSGIPSLVGSIDFKGSDSTPLDSEITEHLWTLPRLFEFYKTDPQKGLTFTQVQLNLNKYGPNKITPPKETPWWIKYLKHYTNFFAILLITAAVLCFLAYFIDKYHDTTNLYLAVVLFVVVIVSATFEYMQEARSEHVMEGFRKLLPAKCHVIRGGNSVVMYAEDLVPGDLVALVEGDRVPADILILTASDLRVDNSSITGESEPVERSSELMSNNRGRPIPPIEANNLVFFTTIVASGSATGIVVASGDRTVMGRIAGMVTKSKRLDTPIAIEINAFVSMISGSAIFMGLLFGILSFIIGNPIIETIVFAIGVIVANVPEGLMASVTVSLAMAAKRMHSRSILVKTLQSVETLGSTTVIASDKTGTLTQNRMIVQHCWYDLQVKRVPLIRNRAEATAMKNSAIGNTSVYDLSSLSFQRLLLIATICNNAKFYTRDSSNMSDESDYLSQESIGDASETGLLKFVEPLNSYQHVRNQWPKLHEIKFNSTNKWQLSIHRRQDGNNEAPLLVMKGAPERVLERCTKIMINGESKDLTAEIKSEYMRAYEELGGYGERVLGFAYKDLHAFPNDFKFTSKPEPNFPNQELTFVGLLSLIDPPREGVFEAVNKCKRARIKVIMVTGDHPITAQAIAKQVGILDQEKIETGRAKVITGDDIRQLSELRILEQERQWNEILNHEQLVFARVSPAHKLAIVEHSQRNGHIVAVTGDGVNDAPALKKADIGIAMGIAGKDVTKEAADMILMDDNFASIVSGVEEGRLIFDNLKKTICYALTVNMPELIPFLANVLLKIPLPLSTVLMLAICLGTDMLPAISLAYEEKELDIMDRPPRNASSDRLVTNRLFAHAYLIIGIVQTFAGFLAYLAVLNDYGYVPRILPGTGIDFSSNPLICTVDKNNEPLECGYGCANPNYKLGLPSTIEYCKDGCSIPLSPSPSDPFSEFDKDGFKGVEYCSLTCSSPPTLFPGNTLPSQCTNSSDDVAKKIGFPGRGNLGRPYAPKNGFYWWSGRKQPVPNVHYQKEILFYAQSAYFTAVVVTQWANLLVCKTTKVSITKSHKNHVISFALVFETAVAAVLLYVPGFQTVFETRPISLLYWFVGFPFAIGILAIGELRKGVIRLFPGGWMEKWTYW